MFYKVWNNISISIRIHSKTLSNPLWYLLYSNLYLWLTFQWLVIPQLGHSMLNKHRSQTNKLKTELLFWYLSAYGSKYSCQILWEYLLLSSKKLAKLMFWLRHTAYFMLIWKLIKRPFWLICYINTFNAVVIWRSSCLTLYSWKCIFWVSYMYCAHVTVI